MRAGLQLFAILRGVVVAVAYGVALIAVWYYSVIWLQIPDYVLPLPGAVFSSLAAFPSFFAQHTWVTFIEAFLGACLGFLLGVCSGLLLRYGGFVGRALHPPIIGSQVFPKEALAPIFLIVFGFGITAKVVISMLICFFPVVVSVERGLRETPETASRLMSVLGATPLQRFWKCHLPFAAPYIFASLRLCATLSVIGAVVGEFVGSSAGLGYVVRSANGEIAMDRVYAALLLLGFLGALFYGLAVAIERLLFRRLSASLRTN